MKGTMTVEKHESGELTAAEMESGLEDMSVDDMSVPRLTILHKEGKFEDSMSGQQFDKLTVIMLGLVKQRVLWHHVVENDDVPRCKSTDFKTGFPNESSSEKRLQFDFNSAGFDKEDYDIQPSGYRELPCESCNLKEWKTHNDGQRPACTEQWTFGVLYDPNDDDNWVPAIMTFQKTGVKPTKTYMSSFARARKATFTVFTHIELDQFSRGQTDYSVPKFRRGDATNEDEWQFYATTYTGLRGFLHLPPRPPEGFEGAPESATPKEESQPKKKEPEKSEPKKSEPVEEPQAQDKPADQPAEKSETAPSSSGDDDDMPF